MKKMVVGCWLLVVGALAASVARAETVKEYTLSDSLTATLDDQGVLTIDGSGPMPNWGRGEDQVWFNDIGLVAECHED